jgi:hypothetical protein
MGNLNPVRGLNVGSTKNEGKKIPFREGRNNDSIRIFLPYFVPKGTTFALCPLLSALCSLLSVIIFYPNDLLNGNIKKQ